MGTARLAIYLIGLIVVVGAVWVFLTQTPVGRTIPSGIALAIILLLVGIGIMASAKSINDRRVSSRVTHEGGGTFVPPAPPASSVSSTRVYDTRYAPPTQSETVVEERRYD